MRGESGTITSDGAAVRGNENGDGSDGAEVTVLL